MIEADARELGKCDRKQREIDALDTETPTQPADERAAERRDRYRGKDAEPGSDAEMGPQRRRRVGTEAEVERVAERQLPGKAHQQIPGLPDVGEIQHQDEHADEIAVGDQRRGQECGEQQRGEHAAVQRRISPQRAHARRPSRPCGRSTSTAINRPNENMLFIEGAAKNPASASETPMSTPPNSAPGIDPSPPMMTMVNASSV